MTNVVVLTGGVGGAKLVLGLAQVMPPGRITAIVNTGDDFRHLGLHVSPDIDTLLYTLAGKANPDQGWGRAGESWSFLAAVRELGGEDWFALGDGDLALHVLRTQALARGEGLAAITARFARQWGIGVDIVPMTDDPVATVLETDMGTLEFQRYFVERRASPRVSAIRFEGAAAARPAPGLEERIAGADVILVAPSNPFLSIDPILAVPGIAAALRAAAAPVVAVSPLVGGKAVKGPTAKLMEELGVPISNSGIADHYAGLLDGLLLDDSDPFPYVGFLCWKTATLMRTLDDKARVARAALALADRIRQS